MSDYPYNFPEFAHKPFYLDYQIAKIESEVSEVNVALKDLIFSDGPMRVRALASEIMDVIHACETALRMVNDSYEVDLAEVREMTIEKNRVRGYYAD